MKLKVINSPFNEEQVELLNKLLPKLTETQQIWLTGYLSAPHSISYPDEEGTVRKEATTSIDPKKVTILFGSQTGNAQSLAEKLSNTLQTDNFQVTLSSMSDFKPNTLKKIQYLLLIVSTYGEGNPPDNAIQLHEFLRSKRALNLDHLQYSVLSLGDSSYEFFCQTGKEFDEYLEALGATRIAPRMDCDLDFDEAAEEWLSSVQVKLKEQVENSANTIEQSLISEAPSKQKFPYSRTNPFHAKVIENLNLNGRGSNKETRHLELLLEGANLQFDPGDSIGVYPKNDPELVSELIVEMDWNPEEATTINRQGETISLKEALISNFEITVLSRSLLQKAAQFTLNQDLKDLLKPEREQELRDYMYGRDLLDLAQDFKPWKASSSEFVTILRKIPPRLYSIASSLKANPDEVHLTIRTVRYEINGRKRTGVFSGACAERVKVGDSLPVYVHRNPNFKLPENSDSPIIMIGSGTGVAPFKSFLEEREEIGARGKTWLFFGDQHFVTDFLYQIEWQRWLKNGILTRMHVAFSRDTDEKVYVQHRMKENAQDLFQWIEEGATVYVCGDEKHMAVDVHATLLAIFEEQGGKTSKEAVAYLNELQQQKRYQRDVY